MILRKLQISIENTEQKKQQNRKYQNFLKTLKPKSKKKL